MGRVAVTEDVEGLRDELDVKGDPPKKDQHSSGFMDEDSNPEDLDQTAVNYKGIYVATTKEVHDAFDSVNTLRYSQPTHLQGSPHCPLDFACSYVHFYR